MELLFIFSLLACCVFLSGVEIIFSTADRLKLELEVQKNNFSSRFLARLLQTPDRWLATLLLLYNASLVMLTMLLTSYLHNYLYPELTDIYLIEILDVLIITFVVLMFVEVIPKTFFQIAPSQMLIWLSFPVYALQTVFRPLVSFFIFVNYKGLSLLKIDIAKEETTHFGKKDLEFFFHNINDQNGIDREILHNALEFNETTIRDCMTNINEVISMNIDNTISQLQQQFIECRHTRIMIFENHTNNLVGYFHHHYLLKNPENIAQYLFKTQTVCETFLTHDLLHKMISEKLNIIVVTDKNNQQIGIIALTDLLIVLFGEMEEVNY